MGNLALLLIDVQQGLDDPGLGKRNNPDAEQNMVRLLQAWRERNLPIIHVQHSSTRPDSPLHPARPGYAFKPEVAPLGHETIFVKRVNSAFIGTGLEAHLIENGIDALVVVGLTTDHCVAATVRTASDLGFNVRLVADATAAHEYPDPKGHMLSADDIHNVHLAGLRGAFCTIVSTQGVLADLWCNA